MKHIHKTIYLLFAILSTGCETGPRALPSKENTTTIYPVSVTDSFTKARTLSPGVEESIVINYGITQSVNFNGSTKLVAPFKISQANSHRLIVNSFVVKKPGGPLVLYYPIVSLIGKNHEIISTIKPELEFAFTENTLKNEFDIPAGTEKILIHTSDEFTKSDFVGTILNESLNPYSTTRGLSVAAGGIIGGLIYENANKQKHQDFHFGDVGIIAVILK